jgi:hypothetical protein
VPKTVRLGANVDTPLRYICPTPFRPSRLPGPLRNHRRAWRRCGSTGAGAALKEQGKIMVDVTGTRLGWIIVGTQTINGKGIAIRRRKPFTIFTR